MDEVRSELVGSVWKILVAAGDTVEANAEIMILESMKMEIPVSASRRGVIESIEVAEGEAVDSGQLLVRIEAE